MAFTFNTRYKPTTTREYTKSDLTVYDSAAGNPNALTIYGKSEVVDGSIISAGEGWNTVDLGTLTWEYNSTTDNCKIYYTVSLRNVANLSDNNYICDKFSNGSLDIPYKTLYSFNYNVVYCSVGVNEDSNAITGNMVYPLADPTQDNCIAVKTDNGTGIDGTMAVFTTGTPLRGIPDADARDVMTWDGASGEVMKNCDDINLGDYTWYGSAGIFYIPQSQLQQVPKPAPTNYIEIPLLCDKYPASYANDRTKKMIAINSTSDIVIYDPDYTNPADLKTALSGVHLIYPIATPTTEQLTTAENASIAGLRTFEPQTHAQNNAGTTMTVNYTISVPTI